MEMNGIGSGLPTVKTSRYGLAVASSRSGLIRDGGSRWRLLEGSRDAGVARRSTMISASWISSVGLDLVVVGACCGNGIGATGSVLRPQWYHRSTVDLIGEVVGEGDEGRISLLGSYCRTLKAKRGFLG